MAAIVDPFNLFRFAPAPESTPARPRSEKQRQASRVNGAKSRGPRSTRGKRQASLNAVRAGLGLQAALDRVPDPKWKQEIARTARMICRKYAVNGPEMEDVAVALAWDQHVANVYREHLTRACTGRDRPSKPAKPAKLPYHRDTVSELAKLAAGHNLMPLHIGMESTRKETVAVLDGLLDGFRATVNRGRRELWEAQALVTSGSAQPGTRDAAAPDPTDGQVTPEVTADDAAEPPAAWRAPANISQAWRDSVGWDDDQVAAFQGALRWQSAWDALPAEHRDVAQLLEDSTHHKATPDTVALLRQLAKIALQQQQKLEKLYERWKRDKLRYEDELHAGWHAHSFQPTEPNWKAVEQLEQLLKGVTARIEHGIRVLQDAAARS